MFKTETCTPTALPRLQQAHSGRQTREVELNWASDEEIREWIRFTLKLMDLKF